MLISIIIPSIDNIFYLKKTLDCIFNKIKLDTQIILIDDGSNNPETFEYYKILEKNKNLEIIFNSENLGYVKSVNKGVKLAKGEFILILNDDLLIPQNAIENMINHLLKNPSIGLISPVSNNRNFLLESKNILPLYDTEKENTFFSWSDNFQKKNSGDFIYYYKLEGYCLLFTKEFYEKLKLENGIFDEIFEIGNFEDTDLSRRAVKAGYKLAIAMDSYIHHFTHSTFKRDCQKFSQLLESNEKLFRQKWDKKQNITALILINDEKYISSVLSKVSEYVDSIALLDTTNTISKTEILEAYPKVKKIYINPSNLEANEKREKKDRDILFKLGKELNPDWFICIDTNEEFEDKIKDEIQKLCNPHSDLIDEYSFKIYYFWHSQTHFRIDGKFKNKEQFKLFRNKAESTSFENLNLDFCIKSDIRVKNYFGNNKNVYFNENELELLKWKNNKNKDVQLSVGIFVTEDNLKNLYYTLKELEYSSEHTYILDIKHIEFKELIILDTTNKLNLKTLNIENKEIKIIQKPNISFEKAQNFLIDNFSKDYILILKSGEIIDYENYSKIINYINNTDYALSNVLVTYLDPIIPYPSFFECRLIEKGQKITFKNNSVFYDIDKFTPVDLYTSEIFSLNSLSQEKFIKSYASENVEFCLEYNKKRSDDIQNLYYLGSALLLNKDFDNSIKVFEKYLSIINNSNLDEKKYLALVSIAINYYWLNKFDNALIKLHDATQLNINSYFANILFTVIYLKTSKIDKAKFYIERNLNNNIKLSRIEKYLRELQENWLKIQKYKFKNINIKNKPIITAMFAIKNEEKYIHRVLSHVSEYVDSIAILDDASTDLTLEIVKSFPKVKKLYVNQPNIGRHEGRDRNILFKLAKELNPDWFICLDGDEIFEDRIKDEIYNLCENEYVEGYLFRMFHFWRSEKLYRVDGIWKNQLRFKMFRNRNIYNELESKDMKLHAQTVPKNFTKNKISFSNLRVKHYGYANFSDTVKKYNFYEREDTIKDPKQIGRENYSHLVDENSLQVEEWKDDIF